ncbi:hypothetical protein [Actimicrobium sp. CCI2.3]|nr:hypothetical protein [Actimicrobium sp. CCI2.3]MDY7573951.1 hypothetical protein [Actimicrobium sp. CCI2.3]MEB0023083.1 hypothetical protein [Actimicrobium sp. CCI2.3]
MMIPEKKTTLINCHHRNELQRQRYWTKVLRLTKRTGIAMLRKNASRVDG